MKRIFFKQKYLRLILEGKKCLEGRVGYKNIKRFRIGDEVYLNGKYKAQITNIWTYPTFKEALSHHNYKLLLPDAESQKEALKVYNDLYPLWKQKKYGVCILEIKYPI